MNPSTVSYKSPMISLITLISHPWAILWDHMNPIFTLAMNQYWPHHKVPKSQETPNKTPKEPSWALCLNLQQVPMGPELAPIRLLQTLWALTALWDTTKAHLCLLSPCRLLHTGPIASTPLSAYRPSYRPVWAFIFSYACSPTGPC